MIFIELADFPADERARIRKIVALFGFSPAQFSIYATAPKTDAQNLNARTVRVEYLPSKKRRAYPAASGENWLDAFAKDLSRFFHARPAQ